jgi:hypothetical protein
MNEKAGTMRGDMNGANERIVNMPGTDMNWRAVAPLRTANEGEPIKRGALQSAPASFGERMV